MTNKTGNAYARGKRAALAFAAGRDHRGNPYGGALGHPERAEHEAWARGYTRTARNLRPPSHPVSVLRSVVNRCIAEGAPVFVNQPAETK